VLISYIINTNCRTLRQAHQQTYPCEDSNSLNLRIQFVPHGKHTGHQYKDQSVLFREKSRGHTHTHPHTSHHTTHTHTPHTHTTHTHTHTTHTHTYTTHTHTHHTHTPHTHTHIHHTHTHTPHTHIHIHHTHTYTTHTHTHTHTPQATDTAKMAAKDKQRVDDALETLLCITEKSSNLRKNLKNDIHESVSTLRKAFILIYKQLDEVKEYNNYRK